MSEAITGVVKFLFGFISNKLRTYGAEKLEDGGLTDQKFRDLIVPELDDIKSNLDAISRKDLCTSISSLQEGIISLIMSCGESLESGNTSTFQSLSAATCAVEAKPSLSSVIVGESIALGNTIGKMTINSNDRLESAKESFKEAGTKASEAFHNAALSIEERILATKVRIASRILQHFDDLEFAVSKCLHYVRELNDMRAIQEIFSVDVKGGIKSIFKKDSRAEVVESVVTVNWVFADFITKFTKQRMAVFDWPMIRCGNQFVHPIHYNEKSVPNLKEMKIAPPWDIVVTGHAIKGQKMNKNGDLICFAEETSGPQKLHHKTGLLQPYCLSSNTTEHPQPGKMIDLAVYEDDTVYVLSGNTGGSYSLSVYSADGRKTHSSTLEFLKGNDDHNFKISVNTDRNIVIARGQLRGSIIIYLCNSNGDLINRFDTSLNDDYFIKYASGPSDKEIVLLTLKSEIFKNSNVLHIFTSGQLQKTVKFHPSEGWDTYRSLFFNQVTKNIVGHSQDIRDGKILIEHLSGRTAELQNSFSLYGTNFPEWIFWFDLAWHTSGTLALISESCLLLLEKPSQ